jgi:flagellar assembly protein FliH
MSSRILRGEAKGIEALQWHSVERETGLFAPAFDGSQSQSSGSAIDNAQLLELRLAEMEKEMVRRSEAARMAGFREGEAAGAAGANASIEPVIQQLTRTIQDLAAYRSRFRKEAEQDLVKLSIAIARKILHRELAIDANAILALVRVVLESIDAREVHRVRLHPADAVVVEKFFAAIGAPQQLVVSADAALERGAAIFETARGNLDASIQTQLAEIERGFADLGRS